MAAPNLLNPTTATGKVVPLNLTTSAANLIVNAAASGTVVRVNTINIANKTNPSAAADVTVYLVRSSNDYPLAFTITVPADASLVVIGKDNFIYLEEGDSITALSSSASSLTAIASYDIIS
jgi:hypothetical protein